MQWDEHSSIIRPDRVSPWELEPLYATSATPSSQPAQRNKRARAPTLPPVTPDLSMFGIVLLTPILHHLSHQPLGSHRLGFIESIYEELRLILFICPYKERAKTSVRGP